ncbi:MAG TPA: glucans biosynthesis glucosyltransferase MdoH [Acetobacteraceae bacterium]|jgi:membrane glycosyltransferase
MVMRRAVVLLIALLTDAGLAWLLWRVLAPDGWTTAKLVMAAAFAGTAPWTGLCAANGLIGFALLVGGWREPRLPLREGDGRRARAYPRTAIVVTVRDEDIQRVLSPLRHLLHGLDLAGAGDAFGVFILSDSTLSDSTGATAEEQAVAAFRAEDHDPARIRYRRRPVNTGFKAGNIMEFLDHHAEGFELMLTLDADSEMSATAVLRLVRIMQADPALGIAQHLTVGLPASSGFPRLFQFGMRAGMRVWATGQAWWQGDEGPYWGHNAVVRVAPFRAYCRMPALPGGRRILSHDQVEAALMHGAGWGVRVVLDEDGSWEANPPALPEFLRRELRWLAGNMQYWHLLRLPGLRAMGRWQLMQAILLFAGAPAYLLFLLGAAVAAGTDPVSAFPARWALALTAAWLGALYAPKLLGYAELALSPDKRARYGDGVQLAAGAAAEIGFTLLLDAVAAVAKTGAMVRLALGRHAAWSAQNRCDRSVGWREAARLLWPQTALGAAVFGAFAAANWTAILWALPLAGGLLAAIPLCVLTADRRFGQWLRERQIAAVPEEFGAGPRGQPAPALALQDSD